MIPSYETLKVVFGAERASVVRGLMERFHARNDRGVRPNKTMEKICDIIQAYGVEEIPPGTGARSPGIMYCNKGDPYDTTVMWVRGRFVVGDWGSYVEKGSYA